MNKQTFGPSSRIGSKTDRPQDIEPRRDRCRIGTDDGRLERKE